MANRAFDFVPLVEHGQHVKSIVAHELKVFSGYFSQEKTDDLLHSDE